MTPSRPDAEAPASNAGPGQVATGRHALRDQDTLWSGFLGLASSVVDSLEKSVQAVCEGRFDLISDVEDEEEDSDRREVEIEQECLRILALYEPVASDLRRMATVLKLNRDWERIADLALRVARRGRKLSRKASGVTMPEGVKALARDVLRRYEPATMRWRHEIRTPRDRSSPATRPSTVSTAHSGRNSRRA